MRARRAEGDAPEAAGGLGVRPAGVFPFGRHRPRIHPSAFVTPGTYIVGRVTIKRGAGVWFGAVLRGDFAPIVVGDESRMERYLEAHHSGH